MKGIGKITAFMINIVRMGSILHVILSSFLRLIDLTVSRRFGWLKTIHFILGAPYILVALS